MNFSEGNHVQNNQNNENRNLLFNNLHEHQGLEDFSNVCRTCASIADQVCPIFDDQSLSDDLAGKMNKYLPIKVLKADGLPQVICVQCQHTILAWDELVKCSIQSNMVLQQKLSVMRLLDPGKIEDESEESTKTPIQIIETLCVKVEQNNVIKVGNQKIESIQRPKNIQIKDGKKYGVCEICKKSVAIASWRRHSQSHLTVKRYSCHICGLGFNDSGNLSRHRKAVHTEHRPHACNTCHRSFTRNSHLQEHIRTHSDSRDYVCDICGKASKSSAALRMHRKIHLNEYRFHCIYCESRFKRRGELLVHVSVHTGEKAHVCGCGKAFRLRHQLASHTRKHIKEIQTMK